MPSRPCRLAGCRWGPALGWGGARCLGRRVEQGAEPDLRRCPPAQGTWSLQGCGGKGGQWVGGTQGSAGLGALGESPHSPEVKIQAPLDALRDLGKGRHLDLSTLGLGCPLGKGPSTGSCGQAEAWLPSKWPWAPLHLTPEARPGVSRPGWGVPLAKLFINSQGCAASVTVRFRTLWNPQPQVGWLPVPACLPTSPRELGSQGWEQAGRSSGSGRPRGALSLRNVRSFTDFLIWLSVHLFSSVQLLSRVQLFVTP